MHPSVSPVAKLFFFIFAVKSLIRLTNEPLNCT